LARKAKVRYVFRSGLALLALAAGPWVGCDPGTPSVQNLASSSSALASGAALLASPRPGPIESSVSPAATAPPAGNGGATAPCGDGACELDWECVDGRCCPLLQACNTVCCSGDEYCNVTECYHPLLCGPGLPVCPEKTYCEDYEDGQRSCANIGHRRDNQEFCARMDAGAQWLKAHSPGGPKPRGTCFPEMAPHRMGTIRWYQALGKSVK
jgi:hypothetical protein